MYVRSFVSLLLMLMCTSAMASARPAHDLGALLKRQSQEFSDASATGNVAVLAHLLDDNVTFMDEDGDIGTKKEILAATQPRPRGTSQTLRQTDWHLHVYGSVAVTAFTDESTVHAYGQILKANFRSTEVWIERTDGWKMISSQTIALQVDPPAIALPSSVLHEYVGKYVAGKADIAIARRGAQLTYSVNGNPPVGLKAEVKDVFFVPGQPRLRRIFQRDANGTIVGLVSRREGHDISFRRVAS